MRRLGTGPLVLVLLAALLTACTAQVGKGKSWTPIRPGQPHKPETLTMWSFHTGPEAQQVQALLDKLHRVYPWLTVKLAQGKTDFDILQAIYSGKPPDVVVLAGPANVGKFCSTGALPDLVKIGQTDQVNVRSLVPAQVLAPASYKGTACVLPWLSDAFGLYYNKKLFADAGISSPPKSLAELEADALKLTRYNPDGSIKVAGFVPLPSFYHSEHMDQGPTFQAPWYLPNGKSAVGTDPRWLAGLTWQKKFIDRLGYGKLQKFAAEIGADSEYTQAHGFYTGKIAMIMDGEWRSFLIKEAKAKVDYGTAPFPTLDPADYGSGQIGGTMISYATTAKDPAASWLVVKYLALDSGALDQLSNDLQNVPTTFDTLKNSQYSKDPMNKTFVDVLLNPKSLWKTPIAAGQVDLDLMQAYVQSMEGGSVNSIKGGLRDLAKRIDAQLAVG